jgi:hypothetical protein
MRYRRHMVYRRRYRRKPTPIAKRMREIWIDGFGLVPQGATEQQLQQTRNAMKALAADDDFWNDLRTLCSVRRTATAMMESMRSGKAATGKALTGAASNKKKSTRALHKKGVKIAAAALGRPA